MKIPFNKPPYTGNEEKYVINVEMINSFFHKNVSVHTIKETLTDKNKFYMDRIISEE